MTGVQAEAHVYAALGAVSDRIPEPRDRVQALGHRAITARRVLDEHRQWPLDPLDSLPPAVVTLLRIATSGDVPAVDDKALGADRGSGSEVLPEQPPAGDPDPVVRRRDVDHVRRVDVAIYVGCLASSLQLFGFAGDCWRLPDLRVPGKEL